MGQIVVGGDNSDGTPLVFYQYDDYNRITQRQDGIGLWQFTYNANSRITSVDGPWDNDTLTYQYDALGRKTSLTPSMGAGVTYTYDNLSRITGVQTGANQYVYNYNGGNPLVQKLTRPNSSFTTYQYDTLNRLLAITNQNAASEVINRYAYTYNSQDLRGSETITNGNPITSFTDELITYDYNKVNQLLSSTNPNKTFLYDNDGNMTQGYTPEGYMFSAVYDAENRLSAIEYTDGGSVLHKTEFHYSANDFLARQIQYENSMVTDEKRFIRDGYLTLQERDASNTVIREYAWGIDMGGGIGGLLNLNQSGQDYAYLYDGKGNVTALIDSTQAIASTYTYDAFGNLISKTGVLNQPYQFSTKGYYEKTGFSYYGYRFYSPIIDRWINRDPLGQEGGINLYSFVKNNPVSFLDPMGLCEGESEFKRGSVFDSRKWQTFKDVVGIVTVSPSSFFTVLSLFSREASKNYYAQGKMSQSETFARYDKYLNNTDFTSPLYYVETIGRHFESEGNKVLYDKEPVIPEYKNVP